MRTRSTLILAAVVAALGTWIYVVESEGPTTAELEGRKTNVFTSFDREKVEALELTHGGKTVKLDKQAGKWRVASPVQTGADDGAVDSVLSALEMLTKTRTIEAGDAKKKRRDFGLDQPRVRGSFRSRGETHTFSVGGEDSTGEGLYLMVDGDDQVYVVPKDFHDSVAKGLGELRDKRIVELRVSKAKAVTIRGGAAEARLKKAEGAWNLDAPVRGRASKAKVEELVRALESMRAQRFIADGASDLGQYGLSPAWRSVKVEVEGGDPVTLLVGSPCGAEGAAADGAAAARSRHVSREGSKTVACAESDVFETLEADPRELRDRRLVTTRDEDVTKISLVGPGRSVKLERDGDDWRLVAPAKAPADRDAVIRMLSELRGLEATEFAAVDGLAAKGLEPPALTVTIEREGGQEVLAIGARDGTDAWVRRGDEAQVLRAPGRVLELTALDALRFRPRRIVSDDPLEAVSMKIQAGGMTEELGKTNGAWRLEVPVAFRADSLASRDVIRRLAELTAERWVAERAEPSHGLASPRLTLHVKFERSGDAEAEPADPHDADGGPAHPTERVREYTLVVGAATDGGYFARLDGPGGGDAVFVVASGLVDDAIAPLLDRNLFQLDEASIASLTIAKGMARLEIVQDGGKWKHAGTEVPRETLAPIFDKLASVRALRVVGFGAAPPAAGLGSPVLTVTLVRREPEEGEPDHVEMVFGAATGEGADAGHYARRGDVDATLIAPSAFVETLSGLSL